MRETIEKESEDYVGFTFLVISVALGIINNSHYAAAITYVVLNYTWFRVFKIKASRFYKSENLPEDLDVSDADIDHYFSLGALVKIGALLGALVVEVGVTHTLNKEPHLFLFSYLAFYILSIGLLKWRGIIKIPFKLEGKPHTFGSGGSSSDNFWSSHWSNNASYSNTPGNSSYHSTRII